MPGAEEIFSQHLLSVSARGVWQLLAVCNTVQAAADCLLHLRHVRCQHSAVSATM